MTSQEYGVGFNADVVAARAAPIMDKLGMANGLEVSEHPINAELRLINDGSAGTAAITLKRWLEYAGTPIQFSPNVKFTRLNIGHYDPVVQDWVLYPDFVQPEEMASLHDQITQLEGEERERLSRAVERGGRFVDLHNQMTVDARSEAAEFLQKTGLSARLINDGARDWDRAGRRRVIDEQTSVMPVSEWADLTEAFGLSYRGLALEQASHRQRHPESRVLREDEYRAYVTMPGIRSWDFPAISGRPLTSKERDFRALSHLSNMLFAYANEPDFSLAQCAVVYNEWNQ